MHRADRGAHILTFDLAKANELSFTRRAILDAAGLSYENTTLGIEEVYLASVTEKEGYYTAIVDGKTRYIIPLVGPGLWGTIEIMAGLEEDLTTFSGVAIVNQSETPALEAESRSRGLPPSLPANRDRSPSWKREQPLRRMKLTESPVQVEPVSISRI